MCQPGEQSVSHRRSRRDGPVLSRARRRRPAAPRIRPKTSQPLGSGVATDADAAAGFADVGGINSWACDVQPRCSSASPSPQRLAHGWRCPTTSGATAPSSRSCTIATARWWGCPESSSSPSGFRPSIDVIARRCRSAAGRRDVDDAACAGRGHIAAASRPHRTRRARSTMAPRDASEVRVQRAPGRWASDPAARRRSRPVCEPVVIVGVWAGRCSPPLRGNAR